MSNAQKSPAAAAPAPEAAAIATTAEKAAPTPKTKTTKPRTAAVKTAKIATKAAVARKRPAAKAAKPASSPVSGEQAAAKTPARKRVPAKKVAATSLVKKVKQKLVRDSFTMPSADFALIDQLKARALGFKRPAKKSELLRAGLQALAALSDAKLRSVLDGLTPLKAGRPKKADA